MARIPVGLQLFSVRGECSKDLPATLEAVAGLGYVAVEPWGYGGDKLEWMGHAPKAIRTMLDDNGLTCCGIHLATGALLGDNLARTIELNQALGNRFLIIAADKPRMSSLDGIKELAGILDGTAAKLKPLGMSTGYHAHPFDFVQVSHLHLALRGQVRNEDVTARTAWDILFSSTGRDVIMQMDIGNCAGGGGDPIAILRKFPGRALSVHLKDFGGPAGSVIGEGKADWATIFRLCESTAGTQVYVVEEGGADGLGFGVSGRSFAALRKMGKC